MENVEITYQVVSLSEIIRYFAKDFTPVDGKKVIRCDHYVDVTKDKVVFQLTVADQ